MVFSKELGDKKIEKYIKKIKPNDRKYLIKKVLKKKIKNSQIFCNVKEVTDYGLLLLKTGEYASLLEVQAIDLSLTSKLEKENFFFNFKNLYQIKDLKLKCYKLDKRINLNPNKENYQNLLEKFNDDESRKKLLLENKKLIDSLENDNFTISSSYYFVLIAKNIEVLNRQLDEIDQIINTLNPKIILEVVNNKLEIYHFLCNLYFADVTIDQLMWLDLPDLVSPLNISERSNMLKVDNKEIQMITIKNIPPFIDEMFFEEIFNLPNVRACINVNDTVDTESLINVLDSSYQFLLSDRNTTKKLSDATELDTEKENFQILMSEIKNGNEKIKEVSLIIAISGSKKDREEIFKELRMLAERYKIKLDIPRLRQMEAWQNFEITSLSLKDYAVYLPTMTLSAGFPFTRTYFNDYTGYMLGVDIHTSLPIFFDPFYLNKKTRTSHNIAVVASTGGGKSYTMKKILVNEFSRQTKILILDPDCEYQKLVESNGGEYIDLFSKKNGIINPLQIRYTPNEEGDSSKNVSYPLPKHLGFLESFYRNAFEYINEKELIMLLTITEALYRKKGIYSDATIEELQNKKNTDYPTFSDLKDFIIEYKRKDYSNDKIRIINQVEMLLSRFLTGTDSYLFNGHTTIDLSNDLIGFNMQDLLYNDNKRLVKTQVMNLLTYLTNAIVTNKINNEKLEEKYKKSICIVVDEFHLFTKEDVNEILANFGQLARRIRKYRGSLIVATQSIEDFVGNSQLLRHSKAIFNNCQYQMVGMLNEADLLAYLELFKENPLTDTQKTFLLKSSQGEFLLNITRKKRLRIKVSATPLEQQMMGELKLP